MDREDYKETSPAPSRPHRSKRSPERSFASTHRDKNSRFRNKKPYSRDRNGSSAQQKNQMHSRETPSASKTPSIGSRQQQSAHMNVPLLNFYPIYTSNIGLRYVCSVVFDYIKAQDPKKDVTLLQFQYVTCIAYWNRLCQLNKHLGYTSPLPEVAQLEQAAMSITLPAVAANYVSSFGSYETANGTNIVPYIPTEFDEWFVDPFTIWTEAGRQPVPPSFWTIDIAWITEWNMKITKGGKTDLGLRQIDNTVTDGMNYQLVSAQPPERGTDEMPVKPASAVKLTEQETEVGAAFNYRNYRSYEEWPGEHVQLLYATRGLGRDIYRRQVIFDMCARAAKAVLK